MARRKRRDEAGASFHVMNRGVARRTIFDARSDFRFFLACLARAAKREEVEVLAYALMRTHFHLLLRSLGGLSKAMRRVQHRHARRFNRQHRRDGPLFRGRFLSRRVHGSRHTRNVVRYIHENPVLARICDRPEDYEWSSAGFLLPTAGSPRWFSANTAQRYGLLGGRIDVPAASVMEARADLVEARIRAPRDSSDERLDASTSSSVLAWMQRKARLADGACSALPEAGARTLASAVVAAIGPGDATLVPGAGTYPTIDLLKAGLLRDVACCTYPIIARTLKADVSRVRRLCRLHWRCVEFLPRYARTVAAVVSRCTGLLDSGRDQLPGTLRSEL